jgi:hypothetical protein
MEKSLSEKIQDLFINHLRDSETNYVNPFFLESVCNKIENYFHEDISKELKELIEEEFKK